MLAEVAAAEVTVAAVATAVVVAAATARLPLMGDTNSPDEAEGRLLMAGW